MRNWKILRRGVVRAGFILGIGLLCLKNTQADVTPPQTGPCNNMEAANILCPYATSTPSCNTYTQSLCNGKSHVIVLANSFGWNEKDGSNAYALTNNGNNVVAECSYSKSCFWDATEYPYGMCLDSGFIYVNGYAQIYDTNPCTAP